MKSAICIKICEGANPPTEDSFHHLGGNRWCVIPWQEYPEGTRVGLYHFRLDVCIENRGSRTALVELDILWPHGQDLIRECLDFVYVRFRNGRVRRYEGKVEGALVKVRISLPPGLSWISTNPAWHVSDNDAWFRKAGEKGALVTTLAEAKNRPIRNITFGTGEKRALIAARMHPYESASSYCALGIAEWLMTGSAAVKALLKKWTVSIIPIANPDGVASGCTRLTGRNGVDLNIEGFTSRDATAKALRGWIDEHQPNLFLNFHNWMSKSINGIYYIEKSGLWAFMEEFDAMVWDGRTWYASEMGSDVKPGDPERQIFDRYCHRRFGALCFIVEFPWYGSTPSGMKRSGVRAFSAATRAWARTR